MKLNTSNAITVVLLVSIICFGVVLYTVVGSSNIRLGASNTPPITKAASAPLRKSPQTQQNSYGTEVVLLADSRGHYWLDAEVDRTQIRFLIDTGASQTVLSYDDARRVGVDVDRINYDAPVLTGAGQASFASTTLPYIEAGHLRVDHMRALVAPQDALPQSVLGVNFLRRLRSYSVESGKMTLVP